jgi:choline dehydrogenase-like flavoprotein
MEIDLVGVGAGVEAVRSQVCVVGGGIAGMMLARKLAQRGVDVVLLEAGGHEIEDETQRLFEEAELRGWPHVGTNEGRARAFGGTSVWWGGLAMPRRGGRLRGRSWRKSLMRRSG